jgi:hypothetical protein
MFPFCVSYSLHSVLLFVVVILYSSVVTCYYVSQFTSFFHREAAFSANDHAAIHMCNWGTFAVEIRFDEENFLQTCTVINISLYNVAPQELLNCEN